MEAKIIIKIPASKVAALIGLNNYEKITQTYFKLYSRKRKLKSLLGAVYELTDEQILNYYERENGFHSKIWRFRECKTTTDITMLQDKIIKENKIENKRKANEYKKIIDKVVRKRFGTKHEKNVREQVNKTRPEEKKIRKDNKLREKKLFETERFIFVLSGKTDGLDNDGVLYEIKTRRSKLFRTLREYEKIQMFCYMFLTGGRNAVLIEEFKTDTGVERDQQEIEFNDEYWEKIVARATLVCSRLEECFDKSSHYHELIQTDLGRTNVEEEINHLLDENISL